MRTAYKCRAYPTPEQVSILNRTFGCVRVVWNRTLAERHRLYRAEGKNLSYAASDTALTAMKKDPDLAFLSEVSSVPLQQTLRHQQMRRRGYGNEFGQAFDNTEQNRNQYVVHDHPYETAQRPNIARVLKRLTWARRIVGTTCCGR